MGRKDEALLEAFSSEGPTNNPAALTEYLILIDGQEYPLQSCTFGGKELEDDFPKPGRVFIGAFQDKLPDRLAGKQLSVDLYIAGVPFRRFTGEVVEGTYSSGKTEVIAATGSHHDDRIVLGEDLVFAGKWPSSVLYQVLAKAAYFGYEIDELRKPLFYNELDPVTLEYRPFDRLDTVADVRKAVREESGLVVMADEYNHAVSYLAESLEQTGEVARHLEVGRDIKAESWKPKQKAERYSHVYVYREHEGEIVDVGDNGNPLLMPIEYADGNQPPDGTWLPIKISDNPAGTGQEDKTPHQIAREEVQRRRYGEWSVSDVGILFADPRIDRPATVSVAEPIYHPDGKKEIRHWVGRVLAEEVSLPSKRMMIGMPDLHLLYAETVEEPPARKVPAKSAVYRTIYGKTSAGYLYAPEEWVYVTPDGYLEAYPDAPIEQDQTGEYSFALA